MVPRDAGGDRDRAGARAGGVAAPGHLRGWVAVARLLLPVAVRRGTPRADRGPRLRLVHLRRGVRARRPGRLRARGPRDLPRAARAGRLISARPRSAARTDP